MRFSNVLLVAAHPDDEVLGAGGTIPLIKQTGGRVTVVIATDGSSTQHPGDNEIIKRKTAQMNRAKLILGTDEVRHWDLPDMRLDTLAHVDINRRLDALVAEIGCNTIFTHHHGDMNVDHQVLYRCCCVVARGVPNQPVKRLLTYYVGSSTEWGVDRSENAFIPNFFVDITATIDRKVAAMAAYSDEVRGYPHPRSPQALEASARSFGVAAGMEFAEPFRLIIARESLVT